MPLYIGKNHQNETSAVQSIFRLAGSDEDALTYSLGFLLAHDYNFCTKLVRCLRVAPRHSLKPDYSVHLQEVTDPKYGRKDIIVADSDMRVVLEAKIGGAEPAVRQLSKYADELKQLEQYKIRGVVALTQVELSAALKDKIQKKFPEKIRFGNVQWHEVIDIALSHKPSDGSDVSQYLFNEFIRYIRMDYSMGYYDAEILIQDVNPENAKIFKEGWMYVTDLKDKKAPLYFAPYFTPSIGISMIGRVRDTEIAVLAEKQGIVANPPSNEHRERWSNGLKMLIERAKKEKFADKKTRLFYLDRPITIATTPISKVSFNRSEPSKKIPNQIPKGFSLGFDELLGFQSP